MLLKFQRDPPWLQSLNNREFAGGCVICLQGGNPVAVTHAGDLVAVSHGDHVDVPHGEDPVAVHQGGYPVSVPHGGDQVAVPHVSVPAALLVAISPFVKKILETDYLLPQHPPVISIPSVSVDVLKIVAELLLTGKASESLDVTRMSEIRDVFKMLRIEACLISSQLQSRCFEDTVEEDQGRSVKTEANSEDCNIVDNKVENIDLNTKDVSKRDKDHDNVINTQEEDDVQHFKIEIIVKTEANSEDCNVVGNKVENVDLNTEDLRKRDKDLHVDVVNIQNQILTNHRLRSDAGQSECNENNPNAKCIENNLNVEQVEQVEQLENSQRSKSRPEPELSTTKPSLPRLRRNTHMEVNKQSTETEQGKEDGDESVEDLGEISENKLSGVKETGSRYPRRDRFKSSAKFQSDQNKRAKTCDKRFNRISQKKEHAVIHSDKSFVEVPSSAKPNQCSICEKMFSNNSNMNWHVKVAHSKLKPHTCQVCGFKASRRDHLQVHVRQHTGDKPFHCDKCEYKTGIPHNLKRHNISHTGDKPFYCDQCDFKTGYPADLRRHKISHTGDKPFYCDQCDYKTGYPPSLRRHKLVHSGEKPHKCPHCQYSAIQSSTLKRHLKSQHQEKPRVNLKGKHVNGGSGSVGAGGGLAAAARGGAS